ncbi:band 7 protein (plasmid) [Thalassoporum mexicanum PCC 7367]|uniref:flotillin family protein n=1 Tax=Thalassoporum mexicanum TaxID=3457544 RepID=UPI00029FCAE6|nr:SPFH domain-containing protein [Pseudanabaena sp. PCC 7367]AFY71894.1 band 7 protein [Pseudanabaena sp. PCC 7367]
MAIKWLPSVLSVFVSATTATSLQPNMARIGTLKSAAPVVETMAIASRVSKVGRPALTKVNPIVTKPAFVNLQSLKSDYLLLIAAVCAVALIIIIAAISVYLRLYKITPNNEAFVKTGGILKKKKEVYLFGGCLVIPGIDELTRVPLREISIDVVRTGRLAVRTQDYLRADMRVTLYVCINQNREDVLTAAARLSQEGKITPANITDALEKRADDAIRAAAKKKNIAEIDSDKLGFAQEVLNLMQQDLRKVGLTLNNIAISEIQESDTYDTNNFFDAQGVRLRTETIQRSIKQKTEVELATMKETREVELATQVAIQQRELEAEKQSLQITQEQEVATLEQRLQVEALKAQREREIQEAKDIESSSAERTKIAQDQLVEEEKIRKGLAVQQSKIDANIALEERNKKLKVAQALQQREAEIAEILRQKAVDSGRMEAQVQLAESERKAKLAQEDVAIAVANKQRESFEAEAEKATAEAAVITASELEKAERIQRLAIIAAKQEAQQIRVRDQNVIEIEAYRRRHQAEIAQQAAELEAESIRTLAIANRFKSLAEAEGLQAKVEAKNVTSSANITADLIKAIWPQLVLQLPEIMKSLAPQAGVLGDARVYSFPGANGNGAQDINQLLLSTSGLSLINTLLEDGKLGEIIGQVGKLITSNDSNAANSGSRAEPVEIEVQEDEPEVGETKAESTTSTPTVIQSSAPSVPPMPPMPPISGSNQG